MPYAHREAIYDADTHRMETPDWIGRFADPTIRPRLEKFGDGLEGFVEHTNDPIGRFERTMDDVTEPVREKFYASNFRAYLGSQLPG